MVNFVPGCVPSGIMYFAFVPSTIGISISAPKIKIKANKGHGKVTYKVSNKKIAKIKKGKLVALKKGKVKLTVTLKATKNYKQKKVTIIIKVK